jgi:hypothetical protein
MEKNKSQNSKIIIGLLTLLLVGSLGYTYYNNTKANEMEVFLNEEKDEIQKGLDEIIVQYDAAIAENSSLSDELKVERDQIVKFRDSVSSLKQTNKTIIRRYRRQIATLEASKKEMLKEYELLKLENEGLEKVVDGKNSFIEDQNKKLDTLNQTNSDLTGKVAVGAMLKVNSVITVAMRKRNSGQLKLTERARSTDALRVNFTIAENLLTASGEQHVYVQLLSPSGVVLNNSGKVMLNDGNTEISYSDKDIVNYINEKLVVITLLEVDKKTMVKGTYTTNIYLEGRFVGVGKFTLK